MAAITPAMLDEWIAAVAVDPAQPKAAARLAETTLAKAILAPSDVPWTFNLELPGPPPVVGDQGASMNCAIFTATAELSIRIGRTLGSGKAFDLSRPALYFYHVLESANCFLERMLDLADAPLASPKVQALLARSGPGGLHRTLAVAAAS